MPKIIQKEWYEDMVGYMRHYLDGAYDSYDCVSHDLTPIYLYQKYRVQQNNEAPDWVIIRYTQYGKVEIFKDCDYIDLS